MKKSFLSFLFFLLAVAGMSQDIPYGANAQAGKYLTVGDAKLYYEVYGQGPPLLLLHGDILGYIDEFSRYLPILSQHFRVIAVATRGHGRSEMGNQPFSHKLLAEDALAILRNETKDSATVVGFSAGAINAYYLAAHHPAAVRKVVAMAGNLKRSGYTPEAIARHPKVSLQDYEKSLPNLIRARKELMPQPERYAELIDKVRANWSEEVHVSDEKARAIKCPVLTVVGDRDFYFKVEHFVEIFRTIPNSQLAIIPGCDHVGLLRRPDMFKAIIMPFLTNR